MCHEIRRGTNTKKVHAQIADKAQETHEEPAYVQRTHAGRFAKWAMQARTLRGVVAVLVLAAGS